MSESVKAIGIDIGGTKTAVAAVDETGGIRAIAQFATRSERGFEEGFCELAAVIREVANQASWPLKSIEGIGIGCAGPVNSQRGTIHNPYTLPGWENACIVSRLQEIFRIPACLENDADAAAAGEFHFGAGQGCSPIVMITIGTGIGGAVLVNGEIYRGVHGEHPEAGHVPVDIGGPECYCGTRGCWESLASGMAIAAAGKPLGYADSRAVFDAAARDARAEAIVQRAADATARGTWSLLHTFLPQRLILGGGIGTEHFERFASVMRQQIARATQIPKNRVEVVRAQLGNDAGVIGAASLALTPILILILILIRTLTPSP